MHAYRRCRVLALIGLLIGLSCAPALAVLPIETWTSAAGSRVLYVRADAIPMVDINIDFDAGARLVPPGREGLAGLVNAMLAKGTDALDEAAIAERFALTGALRGGGAGDERASVSLRSLTAEAQLNEALSLLTRILARPSFPEAVLAREKERVIAGLREAATRPETLANRRFMAMLYPDHPYGRFADPDSIAAIRRDDLVAFHAAHYGAPRAVVSIIGAVSRERAQAIADQITRDLPAGSAPVPQQPLAPLRPGEARIEHPASQSHVLVGTRAITRADPDYFALLVGNYVLGGGGFVSRLYSEVREKRGLAYSVYAYFSPQTLPGPFTIGLQTRKDQSEQALAVVRQVLVNFMREGPTEAELAAARANLVGGFALRIDSNQKILGQLSLIGFHGLPLDWLERWTERIEAVSVGDVRAAFARHVNLQAMVTVVVGAPAGEPPR